MRSRIAPILLEAMLIALGGPVATATPAAAARASLDEAAAARFAALALKSLHQQYPNHSSQTLGGDADARAPRELTPAFYGCYDWHSAVHGHWLLVRLIRLIPDAPFAPEARAAVAQSLAPADRKSTRLNSSHRCISYAVFCLKKKKKHGLLSPAGWFV